MKRGLAWITFVVVAAGVGLGWRVAEQNRVGVDMSRAALKFLETLGDEQRAKTQLTYDTPQRLGWHFIPKNDRKGLQIKDMEKNQRQAAFGLLRNALSESGYDKAVKIMALEHILHELEKGRRSGSIRDTERYYVTVFGEPIETGRWGLSVEGHHLSLNFVVDDGQVVSTTPAFFGSNPGIVRNEVPGGLKKGTRVLADEEQLAFDLLALLSDDQRETAVIADKAPREIRAAGEAQPPREDPVGLAVPEMNQEQQQLLRRLVRSYLDNMPPEVRREAVAEIVEAGTDDIQFAWAGAQEPGVGHYYRIQGPTFLIEFVNTQPDAAGNPANHIHCVWRDMGGDFAVSMDSGD